MLDFGEFGQSPNAEKANILREKAVEKQNHVIRMAFSSVIVLYSVEISTSSSQRHHFPADFHQVYLHNFFQTFFFYCMPTLQTQFL